MNYLGITHTETNTIVNELNGLLANYQVYYQNLRNYHWNISGEHFFDLHAKFENLYNEAKINIDEIAERILTLRKKPVSTLKEYLELSDVKEIKTDDPKAMVRNILENHKILIDNMRNAIEAASNTGDEGTIDMLSSFLFSVEKNSWMLDAWLGEK